MFNNKVLMITGGTGSFGNTVLNRFLSTDVREIRVFSRDEKKQEDMRLALSNDKVKFYIGDVRDYQCLSQATIGVDYIFHAAALKQVPSCEFFPMEAVKTNVIGTENVLNAAINNNVKRVVVLSTDKAVYPINAMGISKALAEKVLIAKSRMIPENADTVICATRYGNVMASRGSVIPLFVNQIKAKGALTVTDPLMTRFLMSLEESVDLVLHAFEHAEQGDIFVQKAPASTVGDLAQALQEIFLVSNEIKIIGTRHGEKLYESLISREEMAKAEDMGRYYRIPADNRDLNYEKYSMSGEPSVSSLSDYTSHNTNQLDVVEVKKLLLNLEYVQNELVGWRT
ncbi:UDP-glucose 4-epimerase [Pseudomonas sp. 10B238]|jgi:UDP-glucose 4-epimerase|uniref:polysaccharide biosynthesis protein n=1 Tax=Pseudomonadaceae TaxID=135621 RepID=UPI000617FA66|nr:MULTISPECIES: polysaccharide biosynthesis protein [Pseudomonadaceae]MAL37479.1 UDP-glucose 4-epimerase [Pseudomonas sp.]KJJ61943.1 UDP-glucose 4-epimerase [Pseudomonas sp. 10B238]MBK3796946.1 NAD-dependent epimerase/dehydratase family protein [Stutzerimonas stutzeri]MBK3877449.1 NAD-dependent epimerase/dehydratase family protein [Stutzerimonas stutzeri]HBM09172.1 UDP-glucose 4-epimerase [Pseudomonas sp.]|tara:strand:- start:6168 stop:7190 length:1023 start_codon:yes stop_codon:yes gene_type:complete